MKIKFLSAILASLLLLPFINGCGTLDSSGVYSGDKTLYAADLTITTSYDLLHTFVSWEYQNRAALASNPEIKKAADAVRANSEKWFSDVEKVRDAYAALPSPENKTALTTALSVLQTASSVAVQFMPSSTAATATQPK
jgi:hypothetical protein